MSLSFGSHTKTTVTSWCELLTLCPLWRSTSEANVFKFSHLFGCKFNYQFLAITMEHQIPPQTKFKFGPRSETILAARTRLQTTTSLRKTTWVGLKTTWNDDSHFHPWSNTTKGHTFWLDTISKGDGHFRKSPVLAHWRHNHNGHDNH